ncbi:MAG: DegT/DnrJ/EryC1/StrS family aminotransferase, partial [Chlorobi bacterium]|nr:DegT/DnrJ/EryC1/StrS family aminotransferase [Chlorobiota bacterium]
MDKEIRVISPLMPPLEEYREILDDIWKRKWLTNQGHYHQELEKSLCEFLDVDNISLFANGTLALVTALQALKITGEVITTPYSFVATTHSLWWNDITPVFVDIDPVTLNIDPDKIEAAITEKTTAILAVHVYGNPCDTDKINKIARKHGLKVIYDAAHAFNVKKDGKSILQEGDLSVLSFHATKTYSTIEGGAIISHDDDMKHHIDNLKNFGFRDETVVEEPGINAKMNEFQAAYGLLSLKYVEKAIAKRKEVATVYRKILRNVPGISFMNELEGVLHNYSYFPVFVEENDYGISRDELYLKLKDNGIFARR